MQIDESEIVRVVGMVLESVLKMDSAISIDPPGVGATSVCGMVQISGAWNGAIVLGCPPAFGRVAASIMFQTPMADLSHRESQDAVAEITNMIGGNLKGLLSSDEPCQLSLPMVVSGGDFTARVPGCRTVQRVALDSGGLILVVNVLEKTQAVAA